jgi:hypothetical protein
MIDMKLILERKYRKEKYSIGNLYIDGVFFCNTLEDTDRGIDSSMKPEDILKKKIKKETAIPYGTYRVTLTMSPSKKKILPRLHSVPGFEGILIHVGNTIADTEGCILVGTNTQPGKVLESTVHMAKLMKILEGATDEITISIVKEFKG